MKHISLTSPAGALLDLEVADTPEEQQQIGLQGRHPLLPRHGMVFVFPNDANENFWNKDFPYSLDAVFIADDGRITAVKAVPGYISGTPDDAIPSFSGYCRFVIALPSGEAASDGFVVGAQVSGLPFLGASRSIPL